jgi:preprotein translocase subunit SecD
MWGSVLCCLAWIGSPLAGMEQANPGSIAQAASQTIQRTFQLQIAAGSDGQKELAATLQVFRQRLQSPNWPRVQLRTEGRDRIVLSVSKDWEGAVTALLGRSDNVTFAAPKSNRGNQLTALLKERAKAIESDSIFGMISRTPTPEMHEQHRKVKERLAEIDRQLPTLFEAPMLSSQNIVAAAVVKTPSDAADRQIYRFTRSSIKLGFDAIGTAKLNELTQSLAGTDRTIGVFINGILVGNAPLKLQKVGANGGEVTITSFWELAEAESLVLSLNSGVLPVPVKLIGIAP